MQHNIIIYCTIFTIFSLWCALCAAAATIVLKKFFLTVNGQAFLGADLLYSVMEFWATKPNLAQSRHRALSPPPGHYSTRVPSISAVSARTTMGKQLQNISVFQQQQQVQEIWKFIRFQEEEEKKDQIASVSEGSDKMTGLLEEVRKCFKRLTVL